MKKHFLLLFVLLIGLTAVAQSELNVYKYVVIPSKYDFQKEANEYGINLLLKYKFQQLGFESYLDTDDLPQILRTNTCLYASPVLHTKSNMFKTVVSVELFDCANKSLFKTQEGSSNSKNLKTSYNESLRKALKSFGDYRLEYTSLKDDVVVKENNQLKKNEVVAPVDDISTSNNGLDSVSFNIEDQEYKLIKKSFMLYEIQKESTKEIIGVMMAASLKKGVHHIKFYDKVGLGYYGENENLIMEFLSSDSSVELIIVHLNRE